MPLDTDVQQAISTAAYVGRIQAAMGVVEGLITAVTKEIAMGVLTVEGQEHPLYELRRAQLCLIAAARSLGDRSTP